MLPVGRARHLSSPEQRLVPGARSVRAGAGRSHGYLAR